MFHLQPQKGSKQKNSFWQKARFAPLVAQRWNPKCQLVLKTGQTISYNCMRIGFALINGSQALPTPTSLLRCCLMRSSQSLLPCLITLPMFKQSVCLIDCSQITHRGRQSELNVTAHLSPFCPPTNPSKLGPLFNLREVKFSLWGLNRACIQWNSLSIH